MKRYIETELAEKMLIDGYSVDEIPSANVEPVRHGHWIFTPLEHVGHCSECGWCGANKNHFPARYCASCGAKMDGKGDEK